MNEEELAKVGYTKKTEKFRDQVLFNALAEFDVLKDQRQRRIELLQKLEDAESDKETAYVSFLCSDGASISTDDIPAFGDILMSIGEVDQLNLIINSPGGDGTVAEKIIELCRAYCKEFRVIVPNRAKSAATIVALGADQIIMGYCSELGPIDAQVPIGVSGMVHWISAQSFIDARTTLENKFYEVDAQGKDTRPVLQQLAGLDNAFIDHCEKLMEFCRDVAGKYLSKYMFANVRGKGKKEQAVNTVIDHLSAVSILKVHGRMVDGNVAKTELGLNVKLLGKDDPIWQTLWNYYVRADIILGKLQASKLIESRHEVLFAGEGI